MAETIYLKPLSSWEQAQKTRAKLPAPLRVLTSLKTTAFLGATLATLLNPAAALSVARGAGKMLIPKTAKGVAIAAITAPTAAGVLLSSKKTRETLKSALDPRESVKRGKKIGEIIEDPGKAKDILGIKEKMTAREKIIAGAKAAGKAGAIVGGAIAIGAGVKKVKTMLEERKAAKELSSSAKALGFTEPQMVGVGGIPIPKAAPSIGMPSQAPGATQMPKPIQNIIQIQVH